MLDVCDILKMESEAAKEHASNLSRDEQILLWDRLRQVTKQLGDIESDLRKKIIADNFDSERVDGTETVQLGAGWSLKATKSQTYKVTGKNDDVMSVECELPNWLEELFRWKSEISISKYKQLVSTVNGNPDDQQSAELLKKIDSLIEVKPGSPQLVLQPPKEKA
jgi:hypothetical protein